MTRPLSENAPEELEELIQLHEREEAAEANRSLLREPRPMGVRLPPGGEVPASSAWLERLYAGERIVREKKPGVFDGLRSAGPYFVSVDDEPLSVIDGMSQTATVPGGFAEDPVVRAYVEGDFGETPLTAHDSTCVPSLEADLYADTLRSLVPGLPQVTFTNSGAEACEKAFALCLKNRRSEKQTKLLAFEGSFHGRTLLALHASYNPAKRTPYELPGHEVSFAPFPTWQTPSEDEPQASAELMKAAAKGDLSGLDAGDDALYAAELAALRFVHETLATGEYFAAIIEPMQSEGGDRYATARFHKALRLLTRHHQVPQILDEVQCGFGLGGSFAWHHRFGYVDATGAPDHPDCVTFAKRAQAGIVMSRFEDSEPTSAHPASLIRGRLHAEWMSEDQDAGRVEAHMRPRLRELAAKYPKLVGAPRATGYAVAFELPSTDLLMAYLGQRFWRGVIVFGAGSRTVRYRLNKSFDARAMDRLLSSVDASLGWLAAHADDPTARPPAWEDEDADESAEAKDLGVIVRVADASEKDALLPQIVALEARVYEPERRDPEEKLAKAFELQGGVVVVAEVERDGAKVVVGSSLGVPLEAMTDVEGPDRDPMRGRDNTLYSLATTLDPDFHGRGLGEELKRAQAEAALALRNEEDEPRYRHITGRNRLGETDAMMHVTRKLGAYEVCLLDGQYGGEGAACYYRMPLGAFVVDVPEHEPSEAAPVDMASGVALSLEAPPASLLRAYDAGCLYGPTVNKITLVNYVTPAVVRAVEHVAALVPELPHLYLTSSRDETFDKALRVLRHHRPESRVALGFHGAYHGHTTAAARSLSDPATHRQGPGYFRDFVRLPHPHEHGIDASMQALRDAVSEAGGPEQIIGLFLEPVQERSGHVMPEGFWQALDEVRAELGVPVVVSESATAAYRAGDGPFFGSALDFTPDILSWWAGAQVGFVHVSDSLWVGKPLTFVSTWDGDELSLIRVHHQLRACRKLDVEAAGEALGAALSPLRDAGLEVDGVGLFRVARVGRGATQLAYGLLQEGFRVRELPNGNVAFAPPLDLSMDEYDRLHRSLKKVLS
ncbi:MAG: aminotransferase class III-fold pyridoxal phosphate-dependent enzyme [Deltaproteobacteria bacterium]|nr:aminotransferase class III-fold pyridoxal phosphate-dependent enzyme [Deltaproteobacteria bacterium]